MFLLLLWPCEGVSAQAVGAGGFLRQDPDARTAALAGADTALADDSAALLVNPAALARLVKPDVAATHVVLFEDTSFDVVTAAAPTRRWGTFAAGYVSQTSGGFQGRAGPNDAPNSFSISQSAYLAGWAASPRLPWDRTDGAPRRLALGLTLKSVRETIDATSGSSTGLDAGALLRLRPGLDLGLKAENLLAPSPAFVGSGVRYERSLDLSPAYTRALGGDWTATAAVRWRRVELEGSEFSGGAELRYGRLLALRLGMRPSGLSTGVGLTVGNTSLDYAVLLGDLGLEHTVSLVQRFGQTEAELEQTIRRGISRLSRGEGARLAKAYLQKADDELRDGRDADARRDLDAASLLAPGSAEVASRVKEADQRWQADVRRQTLSRLTAQALQEEDQGNPLAARQYWRSVQELSPEDVQAREEIARIDSRLTSEDRERAATLRRAQEANDVALALAGAGTQLSRGELHAARELARRAQTRYPENPQLREFLAKTDEQLHSFVKSRLAEADAAQSRGDAAGAVAALESALRQDPDDEELARRTAAAQAVLRRNLSPHARQEAEQLYYQAVEEYLKGDYDTAGKLADKVLTLDPTYEAARTLQAKVAAARRYAP
ncbi:MAG: hypothetical protein KGM24_06950 [Elusimicrobia bacterium]|nr:hypothetical protein [Elusimicrobiota bacterium]